MQIFSARSFTFFIYFIFKISAATCLSAGSNILRKNKAKESSLSSTGHY
jgi:hypothetical protein